MNLRVIALFILLAVLSQALITSRDGKLFDESGRQIIFHGPNVVVKIPPYSPTTTGFDPEMSFCEEDIKQLHAWGFNGMRIAVMWPGVEVKQSVYSQEYLKKMKDIVDLAGSYGIYSLVEFHQDIASEKFCGDGIPAWLIPERLTKTFPLPIGKKHFKYNSSGLPDYDDCLKHNWGLYYFSFDVSYTFESLYTNRHGLLDKFEQYWVQVAKTFVDNKYVIGYEIINEPFAGSPWKNPAVIVPSVAEMVHLQRFYDRISTAIRKVDKSHPICFEPVTWDNTVPVGFTHPPGGKRYQNESILCYHFYMPPSINLKAIKARVNDAKRLGISSILSEFWYKGDNAAEVINQYNKYQQSWFFWGYKTFGKTWGSKYNQTDEEQIGLFYKNGSYIKKYVQLLSQTYVQRLSGSLVSYNYDSATKDYVLVFFPGSGKSIVYANRELNYPNGLSINVSPKDSLVIEEVEPGYFELQAAEGKQNTRVMLSIVRL